MAQIPDDDIGGRVRAARKFAGLNQEQLGSKVGLERRIVGAIEKNEERHELTLAEARRIAKACDVPVGFLYHGWSDDPALTARIERLERVNVADRLAALEDQVRKNEADREVLAAEIAALNADLESRFAERAMPAPETDTERSRGGNRPQAGDPPAR